MEFVFVVPRRELFPDRYPQGFVPFGAALSAASFDDALERHGFFVERERAERSPEWKQIIPYNVVLRGGEVLLLRRTTRGGEARLFGKHTIGVGGHINPIDLETATSRGAIGAAGAQRELDEELVIHGERTLRTVGIINDDSNPVGAVHVGLVQVLQVDGEVSIREHEQLEGNFVAPRELQRRIAAGADFETWSAKLVERLDELLAGELLAPTLTTHAALSQIDEVRKSELRSPDGSTASRHPAAAKS
jgi:predicted NUDIX family phosphoesterase